MQVVSEDIPKTIQKTTFEKYCCFIRAFLQKMVGRFPDLSRKLCEAECVKKNIFRIVSEIVPSSVLYE